MPFEIGLDKNRKTVHSRDVQKNRPTRSLVAGPLSTAAVGKRSKLRLVPTPRVNTRRKENNTGSASVQRPQTHTRTRTRAGERARTRSTNINCPSMFTVCAVRVVHTHDILCVVA